MDELERYLDQVCGRIGGSRSMRQHIRAELREHLRDAVAQHRTAGLTEKEALERALHDFGGSEEVRSELEATHGHRLLAVAVDKALEWKERIMKAKWLWLSWAHLTLAAVLAMEIFTITFVQMFLVPKFAKVSHEVLIEPWLQEPEIVWMYSIFDVLRFLQRNLLWLVLATAAAWGLFEWRSRSEHKTFIRLSLFGTVAVGLLIVVIFSLAAMVILMLLGLPGSGTQATQASTKFEVALSDMEREARKKDWATVEKSVNRASDSLELLIRLHDRLHTRPDKAIEEWDVNVKEARKSLFDAEQAAAAKDATRLDQAISRLRDVYDPVRRWAAREPN